MSMIEIKGLKKQFDGFEVFKGVNANIEKGDVIAVIGPSGTGKSTLLRCLNFLEKADEGEIWMDGKNIFDSSVDRAKICQKMGMVFQSFNLFPNLMVVENVMQAPIDLLGISRKEAYEHAMVLLEEVGMSNKALSFPDELSGGQKQRVAIARALAMKPEILLLDEPTSALDPMMVGEVKNVIARLADSGLTMMIVTHEMSFAREISNRTFYLDEGGIYEEGPTEEVFTNPKKPKTKAFFSKTKEYHYKASDVSFSFKTMSNGITVFGITNSIDAKLVNRASLICEELCINCILSHIEVNPIELEIHMAYLENEKALRISVEYNGNENNLLENPKVDEISVKIIKETSREYSFSFADGKNVLTILV